VLRGRLHDLLVRLVLGMKYGSQASVAFGAGHHHPNGWCGDHPHGHRYTVTVTWQREGYPETDHDEWVLVRQRILDLALELKNRELDKMLLPTVPNVFGMASFFMERLSINVPVTRVEVREDDDPVATIDRD